LIIYFFDNFPDYFWAIWLAYGPSIIALTYLTSFWFKTESAAQNFTILFNFVIGALGGTVIFVLRISNDLIDIGKSIAWILRVVPSFSFAYGYVQLLNPTTLNFIDNQNNILFLLTDKINIVSSQYAGADLIYLGFITIFAILTLSLSEGMRNIFNCCKRRRNNLAKISAEDEEVMMESEKINNIDPASSEYSIVVKNLEKSFSETFSCKGFKAVNNISFGLNYGECFALLGVNGAGKTTTFKCLTNEIIPTYGDIFISGKDCVRNFNEVRRLIGYCPQFDAIFEYMTVEENLKYYSYIKGIPFEKRENMIKSIINEMRLSEQLNKEAGNLSGGNKRKLSVAIALIGNPPIIFLDEPSNGMDPEARRFMWAVIQKISTERKKSSVILTTHSMEEAETLCRRMSIMVNGKFKCLGTSTGIKDRHGAVNYL
jgi:ATP-binding cassette subfamily A (ABC1) protein 3